VAIAFRADLQPFLAEFIEHHRGLRIGRVFGLPAGYAGRRMFVCLIEDGFIVKLPQSVAKDEVRAGKASPFVRRGRPSRAHPRDGGATRRQRVMQNAKVKMQTRCIPACLWCLNFEF
jgi:hypothetical protein